MTDEIAAFTQVMTLDGLLIEADAPNALVQAHKCLELEAHPCCLPELNRTINARAQPCAGLRSRPTDQACAEHGREEKEEGDAAHNRCLGEAAAAIVAASVLVVKIAGFVAETHLAPWSTEPWGAIAIARDARILAPDARSPVPDRLARGDHFRCHRVAPVAPL